MHKILVPRGGRQWVVRSSRLAPRDRSQTEVGPISLSIDEPMKRQRVRVAPNELLVYYYDMVPFQINLRNPDSQIPRQEA